MEEEPLLLNHDPSERILVRRRRRSRSFSPLIIVIVLIAALIGALIVAMVLERSWVVKTFAPQFRSWIVNLSVAGWFLLVGGVALGIITIIVLVVVFQTVTLKRSARRIRAMKKRHRTVQSIPQSEEMTPELKSRIASTSAVQLAEMIREGQVSSEAVTRYFCQRAKECGEKYNCLADENYTVAISEAKKLDEIFRSTGKVVGPLHGVPISLKDCFDLAGTDSTVGLIPRAFDPKEEDSPLIGLLKKAGAIMYIKTNDMQCLDGYESHNPIFGTVYNPYNIERSAGGSSGGEAALIAAGGSLIGLGSDIGGSIRMPAHYCGISGIKPTSKRISKIGWFSGRGQEAIPDSAGPMGRYVEDLIMIMRVIFSDAQCEFDPEIPPMSFREDLLKIPTERKLTIGYYKTDHHFDPCYANQRAVETVVEALRKDGHTVVPWELPDPTEIIFTIFALMDADGGKSMFEFLEGSEVVPALRNTLLVSYIPKSTRKLIGFILKLFGQKLLAESLTRTGEKSVFETWRLQKQRKEYQRNFFENWKKSNLDAVICPVNLTVGVPNGSQAKVPPINVSYTILYNMLDYPAGAVPIDHVTLDDIRHPRKIKNLYDRVTRSWEDETSVGMPVGVQVVTLPFQDELCLGVMDLIARLVPFRPKQF